jgi:hypothetical protein
MQPVSFLGFVKVGRTYINSDKIIKVKEHRVSEGPTVIYYLNGEAESMPEISDTQIFIDNLNMAQRDGITINYRA